MKFEKLNENKLRITLNINDLANNNIDYQSFMANSQDTQKLFLDMLDRAEKEVGFITKDYKIMIEALVTSNGDFIVTVTRYVQEEPGLNIPTRKKVLKPKRKASTLTKKELIYSFNSFENFCLFCNSMDKDILKNINKISKDISLYSLNNKYYLLIKDFNINYIYTKPFTVYISEFATYKHNANTYMYKLLEYGKPIFKTNAIKQCLKYFK